MEPRLPLRYRLERGSNPGSLDQYASGLSTDPLGFFCDLKLYDDGSPSKRPTYLVR